MNCKKCGAPLVENDQFCKSCGASVNQINAQNNFGSNQTSFTQSEFNNVQPAVSNVIGGQTVNNVQQPMNNAMSEQPISNIMVGQPVYTQQPTNPSQVLPSNYNIQPNYNQIPPKKNSNSKFIIIGVVAAVVVIAIIIAVILIFGNNSSSNVETPNTGTQTPQTETKSTYKVNFKGFTFKIPTNLVYEVENDSILLGDEDGTWAVTIEAFEGSYSQMLSKKGQLQTTYQQLGYTASPAVEKNIGGISFITMEIGNNGYNVLLALSKANAMHVFGTTAYNINNEFDYSILQTIAPILSSAEYTGETNNIETNTKINMNSIIDLAK